ncbi:hypothetical protein BX661DRAFT_178306 [Kickxella alabastrina]|uniref:uncharacterized protein n=1 Tax=Kickxella alabastrina TaxID=61397 RepID=UPI0022202B47|nr:uncharacterized protein BX661DRAFT_178306 [Kickxella alabastrina]KAI7833388.1 hypothetical protein BX661DRAFT_178306 [Kickxella alabastrina]
MGGFCKANPALIFFYIFCCGCSCHMHTLFLFLFTPLAPCGAFLSGYSFLIDMYFNVLGVLCCVGCVVECMLYQPT